jgi:exopolysaccharide biosynthesis polyprenyl glycosylphosphotransferase
MTLNAFLEAHDAAARSDEEALGGNVRALPGAHVSQAVSLSFGRTLGMLARVVVPVSVGTAAAILAGAGPAATVGVLAMWAVVHVRMGGVRPRAGLPGRSALTRYVTVPFAFVALAVAVGMLPASSLAPTLVTAAATTLALWLVAAVISGRRRGTRVIVVGDRRAVGEAAVDWAKRRDLTVVGAALVDEPAADDHSLETFGLPTQRGVDDLSDRVSRLGADAVVVLPSPAIDPAMLRRMSWALEDTDATLAIKTELQSVASHRLAMSRLADFTVAEVAPSRAPLHVRAAKAVMDRVGGLVLLVLLAPLLVGMVVAVRLESRGPGLFTQVRVGQNGRLFRVYKMRTMCIDAEERKRELSEDDEGNGVLFKMREDPRITRVGRILRKTSLDELPQLINVVRGDMSLVGPRPALPEEVAKYDETARRRLAVKPGMTGLWQVSGRSDLDWDTTVSLDVTYTDNVTIAEDLRICLRTVKAVTSGKGAY